MIRRPNPLGDLIQYLQTLRQAPCTPELLASVTDEINGHECALACDQKGSKQLQHFLPSLDVSVYSKLLDLDVVTNIYGSHVIERALNSDNLQITLPFLVNNIEVVATSSAGSHVLRKSIVLAKTSPSLLTSLIARISFVLEDPGVLQNPTCSATVATLIEAVANVPSLVAPFLNLSPQGLLKDASSARILEKLLPLYSGERLREVLGLLLQEAGEFGAFAIQTAIDALKTEEDVRYVLKQLGSVDIHNAKHLAIVQRLANKAETMAEVQKDLFKKVKAIFGEGPNHSLLVNILTLGKYDTGNIFDVRASPAAALLVSTLLNFRAKLVENFLLNEKGSPGPAGPSPMDAGR
jgi:hypothetical protein